MEWLQKRLMPSTTGEDDAARDAKAKTEAVKQKRRVALKLLNKLKREEKSAGGALS
jgi:hypothetical protein